MPAELVAHLDYDFVAFDLEHSPASFETLGDLLRAVDGANGETETLVRVSDDDPTTLTRTLDLGPDAILVPMVHTAEQAERIVEATRHPPEGTRGLGPSRATGYGQHLSEYAESGDETFARHVQLESEQGVENAAEIAAVDGIDGIFVGPIDLSMALDCFGEWDDQQFTDAVDDALAAAREEDVAVGTIATDASQRDQRLDWDIDYLVAGMDVGHLIDGATEALDHSMHRRD
jgi:2-dehydro-3-deoxyglucarate aldolase/4-hydroxy-2-oxoheptanedioate aldolase